MSDEQAIVPKGKILVDRGSVIELPDMTITVSDIKKYIAPNATDKELFMFMNICRSLQLNPIKKEVYFVKYGNSAASIIVGYEVYLKRAERSGKLDGWSVEIDGDGDDMKATVVIHRKDWEHPFTWVVHKIECDRQIAKDGAVILKKSTWKTMPRFMLRKVAIAQAFRICFPEELGGMPYLDGEVMVKGEERDRDLDMRIHNLKGKVGEDGKITDAVVEKLDVEEREDDDLPPVFIKPTKSKKKDAAGSGGREAAASKSAGASALAPRDTSEPVQNHTAQEVNRKMGLVDYPEIGDPLGVVDLMKLSKFDKAWEKLDEYKNE